MKKKAMGIQFVSLFRYIPLNTTILSDQLNGYAYDYGLNQFKFCCQIIVQEEKIYRGYGKGRLFFQHLRDMYLPPEH